LIEIEIPKDIRQFEAKLIGPFNTRQLICFVAGAAIAIPTYLAIKDMAPTDICLFASICTFLPFALCGWIKIYGMPFEKFFMSFLYSAILAPGKRKYKTKNLFDLPGNKFEEPEISENIPQKEKTKKQKVKKKKQKFKQSKDKELKAYV